MSLIGRCCHCAGDNCMGCSGAEPTSWTLDFSPAIQVPSPTEYTATWNDGLGVAHEWWQEITFPDLSTLGAATSLPGVTINDYPALGPAGTLFPAQFKPGATCTWGTTVGTYYQFVGTFYSHPSTAADKACPALKPYELDSTPATDFFHPVAWWPNPPYKPFDPCAPPAGEATGCGSFTYQTGQHCRGVSCLLLASPSEGDVLLTLKMCLMLRAFYYVDAPDMAFTDGRRGSSGSRLPTNTPFSVPKSVGVEMVDALFPAHPAPDAEVNYGGATHYAWKEAMTPCESTIWPFVYPEISQKYESTVSCNDIKNGPVELPLVQEYVDGGMPQIGIWSAIGMTEIPQAVTVTAA